MTVLVVMERPISIAYARVAQAAMDPEVSVSDLAGLAQQDPGFASRILQLVNGAAFGLRNRSTDIRHACAILGARGLRNVALGLIVGDMVPKGEGVEVLLEIALRRAVAARLVAKHLGGVAPDEAFTLGLFLEVGLLIEARGDVEGAVHMARMPAADRPTVERAFGKRPHVLSSSKLAADLKLPEPFCDAIANHHAPTPGESAHARVAWLAERVAGAWEAPDPAQGWLAALEAMRSLGVDAEASDTILQTLPAELAEAATSIDRRSPSPSTSPRSPPTRSRDSSSSTMATSSSSGAWRSCSIRRTPSRASSPRRTSTSRASPRTIRSPGSPTGARSKSRSSAISRAPRGARSRCRS